MQVELISGRGSQLNTPNKFSSYDTVTEFIEGLDEPLVQEVITRVYREYPSNVVNKVTSPDVGMIYSVNPYQGCEHGCIYCYARNSHEFWGFSAGLDFESRLVAKMNAPQKLSDAFHHKTWKGLPISLSGNTDCYQPIERKYRLTRELLKVCLKYKNPVGIITKNQLILRDLDLLKQLADYHLVTVMVTVTSTDEQIRRVLEPRTTTYANRLKVIETLALAGIPTGVMVAPIIPGLTNYHIPKVLKAAGSAGASSAGYTMLRLNGQVETLFTDWVHKTYPDRAEKILKQVAACHGGKVNDSQFGRRMKGDGVLAESIQRLFQTSRDQYITHTPVYHLTSEHFCRPARKGEQLRLL